MNFMKKKIGLCVMIVFIICSVCACGEKDGDTKVIFTTGFGENEVFRIDKEVCTKAEIMVYLTNTQNQYENVYGIEIWETMLDDVTLEENVKETVLAKIAQIKTMYLLAQEKEIVLTEEEEGKVKQAAESYFSTLNDNEISLMGLTYETVENLYREYALAEKVYQQIIEGVNPEISDDEARTITVQHILIKTMLDKGNGEFISLSREDKKKAYDKICEIREMAMSGENDFTQLATQYSEDPNVTYSFGKGEMDKAFEEAAFKLGTDEISAVVESEVGYHIIKCINTFNREETDANKLEIVEQRRKDVFGQEYDAFVATLAKKLNQELWDEIGFIHDENVRTVNFFDVYEEYFPGE